MTFGQSISTCFSKYAVFTGRASRSEFWWWTLFTAIIGFLFGIPNSLHVLQGSGSGLPVISYIVSLILFLPSLGVMIRRLHDTGKSGWWCLLNLIPGLGTLILLIFCVQPSQPFPNQYGDVPGRY